MRFAEKNDINIFFNMMNIWLGFLYLFHGDQSQDLD